MSENNIIKSIPTAKLKIKPRLDSLYNELKKDWMLKLLITLLIVGFIFILVYAPFKSKGGITFWVFVSTAVFICAASAIIGGLTGFLFGIPRVRQGNIVQVDEEGKVKPSVESNTSLEQVSNWLTNIIIALGLANLVQIPPALESFGTRVAPALGGGVSAEVFAISMCLFYLIDGFIVSYLFTVIYYRRIVQTVESDAFENTYNDPLTNIQEKPVEKQKADYKVVGIDDAAKNKSSETDDPQKGKWGGKQDSNGRRITATILPLTGNDLYKIFLQVVSTDKSKPLKGFVRFHLHPTFPNAKPLVKVIDNEANLELIAWGSFTVGAEADEGQTRLELNLAEVNEELIDFNNT